MLIRNADMGKDAPNDDDGRYKISTDPNDIRPEVAKQNNSQRGRGIVKDRHWPRYRFCRG